MEIPAQTQEHLSTKAMDTAGITTRMETLRHMAVGTTVVILAGTLSAGISVVIMVAAIVGATAAAMVAADTIDMRMQLGGPVYLNTLRI